MTTTTDLSNLPDDVREIARQALVYADMHDNGFAMTYRNLAHALIAAHNEIARMRGGLNEIHHFPVEDGREIFAVNSMQDIAIKTLAYGILPASEKEK